ncbi:HEC/Ndc80p family-domain-containing protein [Polychytrium aggregatum]|uniref:HEC/Ndc80p family-domain-containing protein n=1 Tax=Polychytrium aggregatum TaxID=110093 RepID=UPI0022FEC5D1|nr:HEC/Ndc80p family-domain-containing protein [Polychytrium aggregatum]KAI9193658.1 HEC/Ndc80p family-domain-containing protein [Polychytrium aggregatum]
MSFTSRLSQPTRPSLKPSVAMNSMVEGMSGLAMGPPGRTSGINPLQRNAGSAQGTVPRRSSVYAANRPSGVGGRSNTSDPRPTRDKPWQAQMIKQLINFLVNAGYDQPISAKQLQAPSLKDFQGIFRFLYALLDPQYAYQKKFEEEVPLILRGLRYPFADMITKSILHSVGAMHAWPTLLAMLTWMVELIICGDQVVTSNVDLTNADENTVEIAYCWYLAKSYTNYMRDVNYDPEDKELLLYFEGKLADLVSETDQLDQEIKVLEAEYQALAEGEDPLVALSKEEATLRGDASKLKQLMAHRQARKTKVVEENATLRENIALKQSELVSVTNERNHLQHIVDTQEISPAEIDKINTEREKLTSQLASLEDSIKEIDKKCWEIEIEYQRMCDGLTATVKDYNSPRIFCRNQKDERLSQILKHELSVRPSAPNASQMLSIDIQEVVKPALYAVRQQYAAAAQQTNEEILQLQEKLDHINEAFHEKLEELAAIEDRIKKANDQFNEEKELSGTTDATSQQEIEHLEKTIPRMRTEATNSLQSAHYRSQQLTIQFEQTRTRCATQTEKAFSQFQDMLNTIVQLQEKTRLPLAELRAIVSDEASLYDSVSPKG